MLNFTERYVFLPVFTLLFAAAILTLIFPKKADTFKNERPVLYLIILVLAGLIQFPLMMRGYLEMGIAYGKIYQSKMFDQSVAFLPFLYFALFLLSIYCQIRSREKIEKTSLTMAVYTCFIIGPFAYLFLMGMIYYFLK